MCNKYQLTYKYFLSYLCVANVMEKYKQLTAYKSRGDYSLRKLKSDSIHSIESDIDTSEMRL